MAESVELVVVLTGYDRRVRVSSPTSLAPSPVLSISPLFPPQPASHYKSNHININIQRHFTSNPFPKVINAQTPKRKSPAFRRLTASLGVESRCNRQSVKERAVSVL